MRHSFNLNEWWFASTLSSRQCLLMTFILKHCFKSILKEREEGLSIIRLLTFLLIVLCFYPDDAKHTYIGVHLWFVKILLNSLAPKIQDISVVIRQKMKTTMGKHKGKNRMRTAEETVKLTYFSSKQDFSTTFTDSSSSSILWKAN